MTIEGCFVKINLRQKSWSFAAHIIKKSPWYQNIWTKFAKILINFYLNIIWFYVDWWPTRVYSRHLLGAPIMPNLATSVLQKIFLLEMGKNGICLGGGSKQNAFFSEKCVLKNAFMSSLSRIGLANWSYHFWYLWNL